MEAASSSSDSESSSSSDGSTRSGANPPMIQSLDELPSDDSVSLDSSSSDEEDGDNEQQQKDQSSSGSESDDDSTSSSSSSSSESDDEDDSKNNINQASRNVHDDESDSSTDNDDDEDIPLEERLARKRNSGLSQKTLENKRSRKKMALERARDKLKDSSQKKEQQEVKNTKKRVSKHAPTEASSSRKEYFRRGAPVLNSSGIGVELGKHKYKPRDPRYGDATPGPSDAALADKRYAFLQDMMESDILQIKKRIAAHKATGKRGQRQRRKLTTTLEQDQAELQRLLQQQSTQLDHTVKRAAKRKAKELKYHPKKREVKRLELEAKFEEIRKRGGDKAVVKAMAKKRRKLKQQDNKFINY